MNDALRLACWVIALALSTSACVGDTTASPDGGNTDATADVTNADAGGSCVFGSSHFGDGCHFAQ